MSPHSGEPQIHTPSDALSCITWIAGEGFPQLQPPLWVKGPPCRASLFSLRVGVLQTSLQEWRCSVGACREHCWLLPHAEEMTQGVFSSPPAHPSHCNQRPLQSASWSHPSRAPSEHLRNAGLSLVSPPHQITAYHQPLLWGKQVMEGEGHDTRTPTSQSPSSPSGPGAVTKRTVSPDFLLKQKHPERHTLKLLFTRKVPEGSAG